MPVFQNRLLRSFTPEQIALLEPLMPVNFGPGDYVLHAGEQVSDVAFLERGLITVSRATMDGTRVIAWVYDGTLVGSHALGRGVATSVYDLVMYNEGSGWRVPREAVEHAMEMDPVIKRRIGAWTHFTDISIAIAMNCRTSHHISERIARLLLTLHYVLGRPKLNVLRADIVPWVNGSKAHVYRALREFVVAGVIAIRPHCIEIRDVAELEKRSCTCYFEVHDESERALKTG